MAENEWQPLELGSLDESLGDFDSIVAEHYLTNPVARASELMGELAGKARARRQQQIAAE